MNFRFPLSDVNIQLVDSLPEITDVKFRDQFTSLNQNEFKFHVPEIADFYVQKGNEILIHALSDPINRNGIELYLNGSILGVVLHQRKALPLHGSSVAFKEKGLIICGDSGSGKSTLSYALSKLPEIDFISDDVSLITSDPIEIQPLPGRIKLWDDAMESFNKPMKEADQIRADVPKYFINPENTVQSPISLDIMLILELTQDANISVKEIHGVDKFKVVWDEIYRKEYLNGMKQSEKEYFNLITAICDRVPIFIIKRNDESKVEDLIEVVMGIINS